MAWYDDVLGEQPTEVQHEEQETKTENWYDVVLKQPEVNQEVSQEPQVSQEPVVSSYEAPTQEQLEATRVQEVTQPEEAPSEFSFSKVGDAIGKSVDQASKFFKGSGMPSAIAGATYAYYAGTEGLYDLLGYEAGEKEAKGRKEFWDKKREEYSVPEFNVNIMDNMSLGLNPMYWNYHIGKMIPGAAVGALTGGSGAIASSLMGGATLSMEGAADSFKQVFEATGDKFAAAGAATTSLFANTLLEAAGLNTIMKPVGNLITRSAKGFAGEGGTEFTQSFVDEIQKIMWEKTAQGYSMTDIAEYTLPKLGGILKNAIGSGATGGVIGGKFAAVTGSRYEAPSSREQAEAILAQEGVIENWEVNAPPEIRDAIKTLDKMPEVELAPIDSVEVRQTEAPVVTEAQDAIAQAEPLALERDSQGLLDGTSALDNQETANPQQTTTAEPAPEGQAQGIQQEQPSVIEGQPPVVTGPLTMEPSMELPATERLFDPGQEVAQEQTLDAKQRMGAGEQIPGQPIGDIAFTEAQKEHLAQVEPEVYQKIDDYFGKDINKPLTGLVKLIQDGGLSDKVRVEMEKITGEPVKSLASGAIKVGHTTFKNITYDVVKNERMSLLGITQDKGLTEGVSSPLDSSLDSSLTTSSTTPLTSTSSIPSTIPLLTPPDNSISELTTQEVSQVPDNLTEDQKTFLNLPEKEATPIYQPNEMGPGRFKFEIARRLSKRQREIFEGLKSGSLKGQQLVGAARGLGVTRDVMNELTVGKKDMPSDLISVASKVGDKAMSRAIEKALLKKYEGQVNQELTGLVEPSTAVKELEDTLTSPPKETSTKAPKERTPEQQVIYDEKVAELERESQEFGEAKEDISTQEFIEEGVKKKGSDLNEWVKRNLVNGIEALGDIQPKLKGIMKRFESSVLDTVKQRQDKSKPFKDLFRAMSKGDRQVIGRALFNRHIPEQKTILDNYKNNNPEFAEAFTKVEEVLTEIEVEFKALGLIGLQRSGYFPRRVKDLEGLMDFLATRNKEPNAVLNEIRRVTGNKDLDVAEATALFQRMIEKGDNPALLLSPGSKKARTIWEVDNEMMDFYYNPLEALDAHIREATEAIEQRRVIGSSKVKANRLRLNALEEKKTLTQSEAAEKKMLTKALAESTVVEEGELTNWFRDTVMGANIPQSQQKLALAVFRARFNQKPLSRNLRAIKDLTMISALGQIGSTITQFGDIAPLIRQYGFFETMEALASAKTMTKSDIDLHAFNKDLGQSTSTSDILEKVLKFTGFEKVDGFFASTNMELARRKAMKESPEVFNKKWENIFKPGELVQLRQDIEAGNKDSSLFRQFSMIELSETRPLFPTDMPIGYMEGGNWRILYALKSWNLKMLNNIRRDVKQAYKEGGGVAAAKTAISYVVLLTAAGVGSDILKDLLNGDEPEIPESIADNVLKLAMFNRYNLGKIETDGFGGYLMSMFKPPTGFLDKPYKDVMDAFDPDKESQWKTVQEIPVLGKTLWSNLSGGGEKRKLDKERQRAFGFLKDAIIDKDPDAMKEFRKRKDEYNKKIKGKDQYKKITYESIQRARERYRKELRERSK